MALSIYGISASRAMRPLWAATELNLTFQHIPTHYKTGDVKDADFLALNPNGYIPVVHDTREDGPPAVVWESMACVHYLAKYHGQADGISLCPSSAFEDAQALRWSFWAVTEIETDALTVLMHGMVLPPEKRSPAVLQAAQERLMRPLRVLEAHVQVQQQLGQSHLAASRFTVADLCVASVLNWARPASALMSEFSATHQWLLRCIERPAFARVKSWRETETVLRTPAQN